MLILTRKPGEALFIDDQIKVVIVEIKGNQVRVGVDAPKDVKIYREEIYLQILEENRSAAASSEVGSLDGLSAALGPAAMEGGENRSSGTSQLLTARKAGDSSSTTVRSNTGPTNTGPKGKTGKR